MPPEVTLVSGQSGRAIQRALLPIPPHDEGAERWYALLTRILDESPPGFDEWLRAWLGSPPEHARWRAYFSHLRPFRPGQVAEDQKGGSPVGCRSLREWELADQWREAFFAALEAPDSPALLSVLQQIAAGHLGHPAPIRTGQISTAPDDKGVFVVYPTAVLLPKQVQRLHAFLRVPDNGGAARAAIVAYVALQNAHLFPNANGRVSRVVFNLLLSQGPIRLYVPIREINGLAEGGVLSRIRFAELSNCWEELAVVIGQGVRALYEVHQRSLRGD